MTVTIPETPVSITLTNKGLVSDQFWIRLTNRIVKDEDGMDLTLAERIMDQALGFLRLCAEKTGPESYSPSPLVDIGWHTFILYTREYAAFCRRLITPLPLWQRWMLAIERLRQAQFKAALRTLGPGGESRFIHHAPSDEEGVDYGIGNIARTIAALKEHGIVVDDMLWANTGQFCSDCSSKGGCDSACENVMVTSTKAGGHKVTAQGSSGKCTDKACAGEGCSTTNALVGAAAATSYCTGDSCSGGCSGSGDACSTAG